MFRFWFIFPVSCVCLLFFLTFCLLFLVFHFMLTCIAAYRSGRSQVLMSSGLKQTTRVADVFFARRRSRTEGRCLFFGSKPYLVWSINASYPSQDPQRTPSKKLDPLWRSWSGACEADSSPRPGLCSEGGLTTRPPAHPHSEGGGVTSPPPQIAEAAIWMRFRGRFEEC